MSSVQAGTGCAWTVTQLFGSRGVSSAKTWSKARAEASRRVKASPRSHVLRRVAISEVCRYSSLYTVPWSTHGDPVAGAVEREAELARWRVLVRGRDGAGSDVIVGAAWFVPTDQQGCVPDVRARRSGHGPVRVVHLLQERLAAEHRRG